MKVWLIQSQIKPWLPFGGSFTLLYCTVYFFCSVRRWHVWFCANMSDSEQTFLDVIIMEVLPEFQAVNKNILEEHLQAIGVETCDDLCFVTKADFMTALRPLQARKLLSVWKQKCKSKHHTTHLFKIKSRHGHCVILYSVNHNLIFLSFKVQTPENSSLWSVEGSPTQLLSLLSASPQSSSSTSSSSPGLDTQWDDNFEIPWSKFPGEVMHSLEKGKWKAQNWGGRWSGLLWLRWWKNVLM